MSPALLRLSLKPEEIDPARSALAPLHAAVSPSKGGKKPIILAGIDYLDRFKGVQLKLLAWEALLASYPKYRRGHVLVQICIASRNQVKLVRDANPDPNPSPNPNP